jgi:2-oxopent-4-enoate/cis-2-oxohex-4-enoate hydratase
MTLLSERIAALGEELLLAQRTAQTVEPLTAREAGLDIEAAYRISEYVLRRRLGAGQRLIGKKIGVTSRAVQDMLGVHQPDFGFLTDAMHVAGNEPVSLARYGLIQPRAEGEIAFVLKDDLQGPEVDEEAVLDATDYVSPCFEIVDSRIRDWRIRIEDTIADNASCGVFALGAARIPPRAVDLAQVRMEIRKNGAHAASGLGSAVQGHPARAVAWLANTLGRLGMPFTRGEIILSGSLGPLLPAAAGDHFELTLAGIGTAAIEFIA